MAVEAEELLVILGAAVTAAGFIAGIVSLATSKKAVADHEERHNKIHAKEHTSGKESYAQVLLELEAINRKLDTDLERMNDAISVILVESGQANPELEASIRRRTPHVWRYYAEHKRD